MKINFETEVREAVNQCYGLEGEDLVREVAGVVAFQVCCAFRKVLSQEFYKSKEILNQDDLYNDGTHSQVAGGLLNSVVEHKSQ